MDQDQLERYRDVAKRPNPDAFYEWLETQAYQAVPREQLRNLPKEKKDIIEEIMLGIADED